MDLSTTYLGFSLPHPFIIGASPLADTLDSMRRAEDAGAAMIVLRSLFEEQLDTEAMATHLAVETHAESFGEALSYFPDPHEFALGPDEYLERIRQAKEALRIPIVASLNGSRLGSWVNYASAIEQAGADALELNLYDVVVEPEQSSAMVEDRALQIVREVRRATRLPLAVKLSPFYTAFAHFAARLQAAGAQALVLFNRFFEPNIRTEDLEFHPHLTLSSSAELLVRLRWLAILSGQLEVELAVTGGVHCSQDAVKAVMCGAGVVQLVSAVLREGLQVIDPMRTDLASWMQEQGYESLDQMKGSMNITRCPNPAALSRLNYVQTIRTVFPQFR